MNEPNHSPGPWVARKDIEHWEIAAMGTDNGDIVAELPLTGDDEYDNIVAVANARLIAAAPELLEALLLVADRITTVAPAIRNILDDLTSPTALAAIAQAAIVKTQAAEKNFDGTTI